MPLRGWGATLDDWRRWAGTPGGMGAFVALLVVIGAALFADHQNRVLYEAQVTAEVQGQLSLVRARLEGNIISNIQLVRGFVSVLATEPEMDGARFDRLAASTLSVESQLRHLAVAPDMVVSMIYPLAGNEAAMGAAYRDIPGQWDAARRARDSGEMVLAGPVDLLQGGRGLVARFPVFVPREITGAEPRFWGIVSAVIDLDRLYADSGIGALAGTLDIAIVGGDGLGAGGAQFYGDPRVLASNPVVETVTVPGGAWQLAAIPAGGWQSVPESAWLLRLLALIGGTMVIGPIVVSSRLLEERQQNVGRLKASEAEQRRLSQRLGLALDSSQVGVWEYDIASATLLWDGRMNELYGLPADGERRDYASWRGALHPDDAARAEREFAEAISGRGPYNSQFRVRHTDGSVRHLRAIGRLFEPYPGEHRMLGVNWDVSTDMLLHEDLQRAKQLTEARNAELEIAKARIEHNALHDSLTGLPNRRYLDEVLAGGIARSDTVDDHVGLLHIDLDRFKQINDTLGHAAGDAMLVHAAAVLKQTVRADDFVARIGGDEFVVLCVTDGGDAALAALADRILARMRDPIDYRGHECRCGVSVGISSEPRTHADGQQMLVNADIALYRAKRRGRNRYEFFTEALQAEVITNKRMADDILKGLERGEFVPYFQPQFDAWTLDISGVEALARWKHPTEGLIAPNRFLPVAEDLNVVATIDRMILEQSLKHLANWQAQGLNIPTVSVNVSAKRLQEEGLTDGLRDLGIKPGTVSFELVESIFLDQTEDIVLWNIEQIKALGIDVEIDDFGSGYASIVSLLKLKPRRLKIDRQLVMPIVDSDAQRHLVASIIDIGKSLDIGIVAEGVETMAHAAILRALGCEFLQGYALARPMAAEALQGFVVGQSWRPQSWRAARQGVSA